MYLILNLISQSSANNGKVDVVEIIIFTMIMLEYSY